MRLDEKQVPEPAGHTGDDVQFASSDILRMFPSWVWKAQVALAVRNSFEEAVTNALYAMRETSAWRPPSSWQSPHSLHHHESFSGLVECVTGAAANLLDRLHVGRQELTITGLWANINPPGVGHPMHTHPNNYLSGVYYLRIGDGADTVNFHDPRPQADVIRPPVSELTAENTDQVVVRVDRGMLLVFPAWLPHSVDGNRSDVDRISVSFNLMFPSIDEGIAKPLWGEE